MRGTKSTEGIVSFDMQLRDFEGAASCPGALGHLRDVVEAPLPQEHLQLLHDSNGFMALGGYLRLFGIGCGRCTDLSTWNDPQTWKFAWPSALSEFLCFGETGWGDQYAYRRSDLRVGDASVYVLDACEMQPEKIAPNFQTFFETEYRRQADAAYDSMTRAARKRIGSLRWDEHVVYVPSLLLGGEEKIENVMKMTARTSMIINGDLLTQLQSDPERDVDKLVSYEDEFGRSRMRVVWRN